MGNLPPGSKAALTLKYVQELALEADGALRYMLPAILNPRYQLSSECPPPQMLVGGDTTGTPLRVVGELTHVGRETTIEVTFCRRA